MKCGTKVFGLPPGVRGSLSFQTRRRNRMRHHRFDPRDLFALQDRMNRLFEEAADRRAPAREEEGEIERADWIPAADVYEDEREYLLALDLPGINREGLDVSLDDGRLVIRGARAAPSARRAASSAPSACPTPSTAPRSRPTTRTACSSSTCPSAASSTGAGSASTSAEGAARGRAAFAIYGLPFTIRVDEIFPQGEQEARY